MAGVVIILEGMLFHLMNWTYFTMGLVSQETVAVKWVYMCAYMHLLLVFSIVESSRNHKDDKKLHVVYYGSWPIIVKL